MALSKMSEADRLSCLVRWFDDWRDATETERAWAEESRNFYDGHQWSASERRKLAERKQPALVFNRIARKVDYVCGVEVRTRVDPLALPRTRADEDEAKAIADAVRAVIEGAEYNERVRGPFAEELSVEGASGQLVNIEKSPEGVDITIEHVPYDRCWWDPHSRRRDFRDAKYTGVFLWEDLEDLKTEHPDHAEALEDSIGGEGATGTIEDRPDWIDSQRKRLRVVECYWCEGKGAAKRYYFAQFVKTKVLRFQPVPFVDELGRGTSPLILASAFVDSDNRRYGWVRRLIDSQSEVNKRRSKALHLMSVRGVITEEGAVEHPNATLEKLATPDYWIELNPGVQRFEVQTNAEPGQAHMALLQDARQELDQIAPQEVTDLPHDAATGRALQIQNNLASIGLEKFWEAVRGAQREAYRQVWYRIRQYKTHEWWVRVRDDAQRTGWRFVGLNRRMTRAQIVAEQAEKGLALPAALKNAGLEKLAPALKGLAQQAGIQDLANPPPKFVELALAQLSQIPEAQEVVTRADVARLGVDIELSVAPDTSTVQQEEFEKLLGIAPAMAQAGQPFPLKAILEASDLRSKDKIIAAIDEAQAPNPEAAQMQQQAMALQMQTAMAELGKLQAQIAELQTQAQWNQARAQAELAQAGPKAQKLAEEAREEGSRADSQELDAMNKAVATGAVMAESGLT